MVGYENRGDEGICAVPRWETPDPMVGYENRGDEGICAVPRWETPDSMVGYENRGDEGIWTPDEGFADPCLTTWPRRRGKSLSISRAGDGIRTHDLLLGKETFYQLNHARKLYNVLSDSDFSTNTVVRQ